MAPKKSADNVAAALDSVHAALRDMQRALERQNERVAALEKRAGVAMPPAAHKGSVTVDTAPLTIAARRPEAPKAKSASAQSAASWEEAVGTHWFARIGLVAIVLGATLFLKYAFDNNWIGETERILLGWLGGIALLVAGEATIRKYAAYGQLLTGGGLVILYLSTFAAFAFYDIVAYLPALVIMAVITGIGILLSLRYDAVAILATALLGGFLTPFLLWNPAMTQASLFSYITILDLAVVAAALRRHWQGLTTFGALATAAVFNSWYISSYIEAHFVATMFFLTLYFLIFSLAAVAYTILHQRQSNGWEQLLTLGTAVWYFSYGYLLFSDTYGAFVGLFALLMALYYIVLAFVMRHVTPQDRSLYNFVAGLAAGFIALALPLQFDFATVTIGWSIELVLLAWLATVLRHEVYRVLSVGMAALVIVRLLLIDAARPLNDALLVFNTRFATFAVAVAAFYLVALICHRAHERGDAELKQWLMGMTLGAVMIANLLTLVAGSQEIVTYYERQEQRAYAEIREMERAYGQAYPNGSWQYSDEYRSYRDVRLKLESQQSIMLSLFWIVYAIIVMIGGFVRRNAYARMGGILLFALAILKLFFYDLWSLGTLYRIISSTVLGVVLLSISYAYNRYKDRLGELIKS